MSTIRPYRIEIPQDRIDDLQRRLRQTRWPHSTAHDFSRGQPVSLVRELAGYWAEGFDWREREAQLNRIPQFMTEIDGQPIHFMHVRSKEPAAFALILTHGWPSSPAEYLDLIGPLTDPRAHGLDLLPTRYGAVAAAMGAHGEDVLKYEDLGGALKRAGSSGKPALVNVMIERVAAPRY